MGARKRRKRQRQQDSYDTELYAIEGGDEQESDVNSEVIPQDSLLGASGKHTEDTESLWLMSYSDLMTLLVGFFALLLSFTTVDAPKFEKLKKETAESMGGKYEQPFTQLSSSLKEVIDKKGLSQQVKITENEAGVTMRFRGELFFDIGSVELTQQAQELLGEVVKVVNQQAKGFDVVIEGHTDNIPIQSRTIASNWELSGLRASRVARMFEAEGFQRKNIQIVGWADTKPLVPNQDKNGNALPKNQEKNRRVVVKILRKEL